MNCNHKWETIDTYKKFTGKAGGGFLQDTHIYFTKVFVQKCETCGKIEQSEI